MILKSAQNKKGQEISFLAYTQTLLNIPGGIRTYLQFGTSNSSVLISFSDELFLVSVTL